MPRTRFTALVPLLLSFAPLSAQQVSVGGIGGTHVTNHFPATDFRTPADPFNPASRFQFESGRRSWILGASLEGRLSDSFSIEADVLHRRMKSRITFTTFPEDGPTTTTVNEQTSVRTWVFPVLLKYKLPVASFGPARPFFTAGPSFRTQEEASAAEPSQIGATAGVGFALDLGRFEVSPTLRYTRWRRENVAPRYDTKPDQVEFLTSFAWRTRPRTRRIGGREFEIGLVAGYPLTRGFSRLDDDNRERTRYLAGLTAQMDVNARVAVEVDAIYRPLRAISTRTGSEEPFTVLTWQFPVLAKYRLSPDSDWTPVLQAGPSFRLSGNLNGADPSHVGATFGAGVEKRVGLVRVAPTVRYTFWTPEDRNAFLRTNPNSVELVLGASF